MRIISIRKGFTSDHSSTSYEFLAVDKALDKKERAEVASLSRRANPTSRSASFTYHVDGYDIPGGWKRLLENYYDVMYREEYDWWTLAFAFNTNPAQFEALREYGFSGGDDLGIIIEGNDRRAIVAVFCRIDGVFIDDDEYDDEEWEEVAEAHTADGLLNLLVQVRQQLINGDYRTLYAVWEKYGMPEDDCDEEGEDDDDFGVPVPQEQAAGKGIVAQFKNMLEH